jgi:GTP diphosphokinase / guanosine-3',5'-bis(diphosphate) 3'-diphosphatase
MAGEARDPNEFFEHVKVGLATDSVYVFTPGGKIMDLPRGATIVDFAYYIHSDVGNACMSATVNAAPAPLRTELASGDVVEVQTDPTQTGPNPEWLAFVQTPRARQAIRHTLRNTDVAAAGALGKRMLTQALAATGLELKLDSVDWSALLKLTGESSIEELWVDLAMGKRSAGAVARGLVAAHLSAAPQSAGTEAPQARALQLDGTEGGSVRYASCCHPIPGDAVIGNLGRGEGLEVHTANCAAARRQFQRSPQGWIDVAWADHQTRSFDTLIVVRVSNGKGVLAKVSTAISSADADIVHMNMGDARAEATTDMQFLVSVRDREHLEEVFRRLRNSSFVLQHWRHVPAAGH